MRTMRPEELIRLLQEGELESDVSLSGGVIREGMVRPVDDNPQGVLFSEGRSCRNWTRIPLDAIESVEYVGLAHCHNHQHPYVRLRLVVPTDNPTAALFAELLMKSDLHPSTESSPATSATGEAHSPIGVAEDAAAYEALGVHELAATQRIDIQFDQGGDGRLSCGAGTFLCQGRRGVRYPRDLTITTADKHGTHWSNEFQVWMNYSILIWGQRGIYIHEWPYCRTASGPSAGCIHLCPGDAAAVYNWIVGRTRITISYPW